jgi:hypothetical protein
MSEVAMVKDTSVMDVKLGRRELVSANEAATWLQEAASGKGFLASVLLVQTKRSKIEETTIARRASDLNRDRLAQIFGLPFLISVLPGIAASFGIADLVGDIPGATGVSVMSALAGSMFAIPFVAGASVTAASLPFYKPYQRRYVQAQKQLTSLQGEGVRAWLHARYNIQVTYHVREFIAGHVLSGTPEMHFDDADGRWWTMKFDTTEEAYYVIPKSVEVSKVDAPSGLAKQADVILSVGAAHLDGELGQLGARIDARLTQLHKFALSLEEAHVLSRTVEDAREAVTGFERLELLGAAESGSAYLLDVLRLLDSELESIVQAKVAQETEALLARKQRAAARQDMVGV